MSTTKALNYHNFLDLGSRTSPKPLITRRMESLESTSKVWDASTAVKVELPVTLIFHHFETDSFVTTHRKGSSKWLDRRSKEPDLRFVYSAGGRAIVRPADHADDFELLRKKIRQFAELPDGWDSHSATAPPAEAIDAALAVVRELESAKILPEWVVPTGDSSILMSAKKRGTQLKWEVDSDGDIAVMLKPMFSPPTYHDLEPSEIGAFLKENLRQG